MARVAPLTCVLILLVSSNSASADGFSLDWSTIDGGGGTSFGGNFILSGTIGQPDAGTTMSGGNFEMTGGFWAIAQEGADDCTGCADSNCDGIVSPGDIAAFVAAITGGSSGWVNWHMTNLGMPPSCEFLCANDINGDEIVTPGDIAGFVAVLTGGAPCN